MSLLTDANDAMRDLFRRLTSEGVAGGVAQATDPVRDPLDQLKKLAELREMGGAGRQQCAGLPAHARAIRGVLPPPRRRRRVRGLALGA